MGGNQEARARLMALAERKESKPERIAVDHSAWLYHACGGRLYRLLLKTLAENVILRDGMDAQTHITALERAISANTTTRFADNIAQRDALEGLISGDRCYVADATADPTVAAGGAMYLWTPGTRWTKLWNGQNPVDFEANIDGESIKLDEFGRLKTDFNAMPEGTLASLMAALPPEQIAAILRLIPPEQLAAILALALGRGLHLEEGRIAARLSDAVDLEDAESAASSLAVAKVGAKVASNEAGLQDLNRKMSAALPAIESAGNAAQTAGEAAAIAMTKAQEALERAADVAKMEGPAGRDGADGAPGRDGVDGKDGEPGQDGRDGAAAGFGTPTVTVDANVGVPSCSISATGPDTAKVFSFEFKNLKGEPGRDGVDGKDGAPGRDGVDGRDGTEAPLASAENDGLMAAADKQKLDGIDGEAWVKKAGDTMTGALGISTADSNMLKLVLPDAAIGQGVSTSLYRGIGFYDQNDRSLGFFRVCMGQTGYPQLQSLTNNGGGIYSFYDPSERRNKTLLHVLEDSANLENNEIFSFRWFRANARRKLTANKTIYVATNGSDTLTAGRGESAATPFKTIQAAVNYARDNLDLGPWNVTISIAAGTYQENVTIPQMVSSGGGFFIQAADANSKPTIKGSVSAGPRADITLNNLNMECAGNGVVCCDLSRAFIYNCSFTGTGNGTCLNSYAHSLMDVGEGCSFGGSWNTLWSIVEHSRMHLRMDVNFIDVSATKYVLALNMHSMFFRSGGVNITGSATGKRYSATLQSFIFTFNAGAEFIHGTIAGTCDSSSFYA